SARGTRSRGRERRRLQEVLRLRSRTAQANCLSIGRATEPRGRGEIGRADRLCLHRLAVPAHDVALHCEILGKPELVDTRSGRRVALLHPLPELAVVVAREGRAVLLALVLEDREDLELQLVLRERDEHVGLGDGPLLPGTAVVPHRGRLTRVLLE